jgi:hypothetical protein
MKTSKLKKAKSDIARFFLVQPSHVFLASELKRILASHILDWKIDLGVTLKVFVFFLLSEGILREIKLSFPGKTFTRYIHENASVFEIALSLYPKSYLCHYSAVFLHALTEQIPKTVYVNHEQRQSSISVGELQQSRIDMAFRNAQRVSNYRAAFQDQEIIALNGKNTNNLAVMELKGPHGETLRVTNIERTLIDIVVRPMYAGGVFEVLNAYKSAAGRISINKLTALLKQLKHTYPYHQAIGFYLERAGVYSAAHVDLLKKAFPMELDFYLVHGMREKEYSKKWRLYYPKGM